MKRGNNMGNVPGTKMDTPSEKIYKRVLCLLKYHDPGCFDSPQAHYRAKALDLALPVIRQIATNVTETNHDVADSRSLLLKIRAELADTARTLKFAMNPLWEYTPRESDDRPKGSCVPLIELARAQLNSSPEASKSPVLRALVQSASESVAEDAFADDGEVVLSRAVRCRLTVVSLLLQRASACLWTELLLRRSSGGPPDQLPYPKIGRTSATADQTAAYLDALRKFADAITALVEVDLTSLPVGEEAVAEADGLCVVRHFVRRRHDELRRWVNPKAVVDSFIAGEVELSADRGEQIILELLETSPNSSDPANWMWHYPDALDLGDMLCDLHHAADAAGVDFDEADGRGDWHYKSELRDQKEESQAQ